MTSTEGSFSARLDGDSFLITSYHIDRQAVGLADLTLIRGGHREAGKRPSRAVLLHQAIYRRHPQVQAIVNAVPVNATAFSVTATALDTRTIPESYLLLADVAQIPFGLQYEDGERVASLVAPERPIALIENDGALALGTTVLDAFDRLEVLEATAEAVINSRAIGSVHRMSDEVIAELVQAFSETQ
jgi:L-fuculose-phosphate aldolase